MNSNTFSCSINNYSFQVNVFECQRPWLLAQLKLVYPDLPFPATPRDTTPTDTNLDQVWIVTTIQPLQNTGDWWSDQVEAEKQQRQQLFFQWAEGIARIGQSRGFWVDYTDPASGLPVKSRPGPSIWSDVEHLSRLLRYPTKDLNGCQILVHPTWGEWIYPASLVVVCGVGGMEFLLNHLTTRSSNNKTSS